VDIRLLGEHDLVPWADLLAAAFDRSHHNMIALLKWLRTGWHMIAYGVWDNNILAAQYSCLQMQLAIPGYSNPLAVGMSVNMATHPQYRGQGLIKQVAAPVYETLRASGVVAGVGFSNAAGVKVDRHSKGYGYQVVGQLLPSIAVVSPFRHTAPDFYTMDRFPSLAPAKTNRPKIHFNAMSGDIDHRFGQHPFRQYQFGVWRSKETIHGVVVYQDTHLYRIPAVSLLAVYSDRPEELLSRWLSSLKQARLVYVLTTPGSFIRTCLSHLTLCRSLPWVHNPYYLTLKPLSENMPSSLLDFTHWNCIGGDVL
jgi:hypothetical protein